MIVAKRTRHASFSLLLRDLQIARPQIARPADRQTRRSPDPQIATPGSTVRQHRLQPLSVLRRDIQKPPKMDYSAPESCHFCGCHSTMPNSDSTGEDVFSARASERELGLSRTLPADVVRALRWLRGHL